MKRMLALNGWTIPTSINGQQDQTFEQLGLTADGVRGHPVCDRKSIARTWRFETAEGKFSAKQADTLVGLLEGPIHSWSFERDAFSDSGVGPELGSQWTLIVAGGPPSNRGGPFVVVGAGGLVFDCELIEGRWTVLYWLQSSPGARWRRVAERSDGAVFVDGQVGAGGVVVVGSGGLAFPAATRLAGLMVLPFHASDDFIEADFAWQGSAYLLRRWPLDGSVVDDLGGVGTLAAVDLTFEKGRVGRAASFNGSTSRLELSPGIGIALAGVERASFACWCRPDTLAFAAGYGTLWMIRRVASGNHQLLVRVFDDGSVGVASQPAAGDAQTLAQTAPGTVEVDIWSHIAVAVLVPEQRIDIFVDGSRVLSHDASADWAGGTIFDGTTVAVSLGFDLLSATDHPFSGRICEASFHHDAIDLPLASQMYEAGRWGRRALAPQDGLGTPFVRMYGQADDYRVPTLVCGEVTDEQTTPHGSSAGWVNNDRSVAFTLEEVEGTPPARPFPRSDLGFLLSQAALETPLDFSVVRSVHGLAVASVVGIPLSSTGGLGPARVPDAAFAFDGAGDELVVPSPEIADLLCGARGASIFAWVRPTATRAQMIAVFPVNATDIRISLELDGTNRVLGRARAASGDTLRFAVGGASVPLSTWSLVGMTVDLEAGIVRSFLDGVEQGSTSGAIFSATRFSNEPATASPYAKIGRGFSPTIDFLGSMAAVHAWRRRVEEEEIRSMFEAGARGVLF